MPHKHTRREHDPSAFDLPPSQIARPLPVNLRGRQNQSATKNPKTQNDGVSKNRKKRSNPDDAPRAFKRLMALAQGQKQRSGLDDGRQLKSKKKGSKKADNNSKPAVEAEKPEMPKIRPGEKMSDFAARVNATLPLAGLVGKAKDGKDPLGLKTFRTRKERKMHKLYDQWRAEERKIQERREEQLEEAAERELDEEINGGTFGTFGMNQAAFNEPAIGGKKKKNKKRKGANHEEDPWHALKKMRQEAKVGLHDVAQAPPELNKAVGNKMLVRGATVNVTNVPKSAGSLRRREELQEIREEVLASYRRKKEEKLARLTSSA
ncbi:hypothetical protein CCHL11_09441 [Colletotrichum chlorophyti]|uniref:Urease accessory protein UreD n=1 Tax=Colletotrichum chlorophyti TaxID=708187 RepID=A0A1Q8S203_9PEZI|nr:hypothetical protein CCHL11_09441 [Colletotrichum chlorophyti]